MMSGVPYLGSKISLISKSEIRYEGILYTIDTKESTVALAKVRSFGTEGRPTDRPVAPRDEVYEYIIFRASDIKDLHVCESPKSYHTLPHDPAIVQHSPPIAHYASLPYGQAFGSLFGLPSLQPFSTQTSFPHIPQSFFASSHHSGTSRSTTTSQRKSPTSDAGIQVSVDSALDLNQNGNIESRDQRQNSTGIQRRQPQGSRRQPFNRRGGARRGRGRGGAPFVQEVLKFDGDYDFEQANAEFQELESKLANAQANDVEMEVIPNGGDAEVSGAYDKKKSFFDEISCEATQRSKGFPRFDWKMEQKLNIETFGVSMPISWMRRRRGRGGFRRGYGGRGGNSTRIPNENQKTVTFDDTPAIKEVEVLETVEEPKEEIPVIELIVDKENEWPEAEKPAEVWP